MSAAAYQRDDARAAMTHLSGMSNLRATTVKATAPSTRPIVREFGAPSGRYRWTEGAPNGTDTLALRSDASRAHLAARLRQEIVPELEQRGARGLVFRAAPSAGVSARDVRWVVWRTQRGDGSVWALYLASRCLAPAGDSAANDAFVLAAWGEGQVLAWADEREGARSALRAALSVPPPWLKQGFRSHDETFPVRIDAVHSPVRPSNDVAATAVTKRAWRRSPVSAPAANDVLLEIVKAWRRTHAS